MTFTEEAQRAHDHLRGASREEVLRVHNFLQDVDPVRLRASIDAAVLARKLSIGDARLMYFTVDMWPVATDAAKAGVYNTVVKSHVPPTPPIVTGNVSEFFQRVYSQACALRAIDWSAHVADWIEGCVNTGLGQPTFRSRYAGLSIGPDCVLGVCYGSGRGSGMWFRAVPADDLEALRVGVITYEDVLAKYGAGRFLVEPPRRRVSIVPGWVGP